MVRMFLIIKKQPILTIKNTIIDLEFIKIKVHNIIIAKFIMEVKGFLIKRYSESFKVSKALILYLDMITNE